jgi:hypothetical protein
MFIMFMLFNRRANVTYSKPAVMSAVPMQPAKAGPALGSGAVAAEQPATYEELLPYLVLAMAISV